MRKYSRTAATAAGVIALTLLGAGGAQAAPARPDLVVTAVTASPASPANGQAVTFKATIKNQGSVATPSGVVHGIGFQVDGVLRTWSDYDTAALAPGASITLNANGGPTGSSTWTASTGKHEVLAFVDDAGRIAESDEGNNRTKVSVTVSAKPTVVQWSTVQGGIPKSTLSWLRQKTGLASYVTGSAYASCVHDDGMGHEIPRAGTETYIGQYGAGNLRFRENDSYAWSGTVEVPAGVTKITSGAIDVNEIATTNYGAPSRYLICPSGERAAFTRLHATKITTNRYALVGGYAAGALLGTFTGPVKTDLKFGY